MKFVFRRTGDTSEELRLQYRREFVNGEYDSDAHNYFFLNAQFPAGQSEITKIYGFSANFDDDQVVGVFFPFKVTAQIFGDGQLYGVHRIWKAGIPNTASTVYYDDDRTRSFELRAAYPNSGQVGQTINIDFNVLNTGSEPTENTITVSSVQRAHDDDRKPKPPEPRVGCSISGPLAAGETGTCRATFTLTAQDLADSPMALDATASDGTTNSGTFRIYLRVVDGVTVGFKETNRLSVLEPANGAANAQAVLEVTRVGELEEQVQVAYTINPIRAPRRPHPPEAGVDYADNSATPGILTFAANQTEENITIDILGDEVDEQYELFRVTLVPPEGVLVEAEKRDRVVAILDADPPTGTSYTPTASLELVSADPTPESAGSVDFAVVLDRVWGEDARFEVELDAHDNLTATPAFSRLGQTGDFEAPGGLIHATIPAGQTRFEFSLTLYDDDVREEDETFQMLLGSSLNKFYRQIGNENKALATIADDDFVEPTGVELALTSNNGVFDSVAENSSQHNITVTASFSDIRWPTDASDAALHPADPRDVDTAVRVEFDSANSAAAQTDLERFQVADSQGTFQDVESFDIVIPAGQTSGTTTLRFKPANDDVDEEGETVILQGSEVLAADSDEFLPVSSASFTITDDDTRGITPSPAKLATGAGISMKEGGTSTYSLVLDTEPTDTVTVTVARGQGDLISLTPETLTFTPSDWSTAQTISVVSLDDGTDTPFTFTPISHQVSGGDYDSVTVRDIWVRIENTTQAYVYLDDAQASESDGHLEFTVTVRPILRTVPVEVRYATVDGTAVAGTDYTRQVNTGQTYKIFTIPANRDTGAIRIPITDNQVYGPAKKTFTLQLTNQNNKANLEGDATSLTATGSILDDDPKPVVSVAGPAGDLSYVSEDIKGPVTFTLTLAGRSAADVTVDYATGQAQVLSGLAARQGTTAATAGEDYTAATGSVTFSPGDTTKHVTVQLTDDDLSEDTEFFGFKISNVQNAQLRNRATEEVADVGLLDDDPRGVTIDPTSISLDEPATGETAVASSYTVKLNSEPTGSVTVTIGGADPAVTLSGGTLSNTSTLTFTDSNWNTAQTVTVTPVKDANGTSETITLTHTQSGGDYNGIAADSVTVNVTDSDTRDVVLSPTSLTLTEGDATGVSYSVKLATQPSGDVTVTIGGHSGTDLSISGAELTGNQLTFTASNWDTAQTVTVKAGEDDNADDESETLRHTASGGDYANITRDLPATVTDDAPETVTVSFGAAAYTVAESDVSDTPDVTENTVEVTVTLSADPERTVVIPIEKTNEGGASGSDYSGVPQNVTFDSGATSKTFTFTAAHDTVDDDGESVLLSFGATLPDGLSAGTPATSAVNITDDDVPVVTVSFGSDAYTVAEGGTQQVTVTLSADPERTVVIPIEAANQGGATTADYSAPSSVTFSATETSKSFTFMATEDSINDDGESVLLAFGALPGGVSAGTPNQATVSITDDDVPSVTVSYGSDAYTVAEGGTQSVTVTLSADPERTVVIPIETANQGGASGSDYSGVPQSVTFDSGDTSKSFDISATEDNLAESGERVKLSFGALPTDATAGTPSETTVSIADRIQGQNPPTPPTVHFENATYSVDEGASTSIKVILSKAPGSEAVIPISRANRAGATDPDYSGVPDTLTFGATDTEKTITFAATDDTVDDDGEKVELSFGTLPGGITTTSGEATVAITDNDDATARAIVLSPASLTVTEEDTTGADYTVKLASQPSGGVTVTLSGLSGTDLILSGTTLNANDALTLTFTDSNWDTAQTVTVKSNHDADPFDDNVYLLHRAMGGGYDSASRTLPVTVTDNDTAAVVLTPDSITVGEGETAGVNYTVKLSHAPTSAVTVTIGGHSGTALSISGTTLNASDELTFTASNWSAAQTVTVKADNDDNAASESLKLTHTPSGGGYSAAADLTVMVTDDDTEAIVLSKSALTLTEGDDTGVSYTVKLATQPSETVTVTIGGHAGTDLSISGTTLSNTNMLTFTASNWDTAQTVTVKAGEDANADDESETLTHTASGGDYANITRDLPATVTDDAPETVTVSFGAASYTVAEGSSQTITVSLDEDPERTVVIPIETTNEGGASDSDYTGVPQSVTFEAGDTSKTFDVSATEDNLAEAGEKVKLSFGALPSDATAGTPGETTVSIADRIQGQNPATPPTVHFENATYSVDEGSSASIKVILSKAPGSEAVIPISRANRVGATDTDYSGVPDTLTFGATDTEKTITFAATDDTVDDDGEKVELSFGTLPGGITATSGEASEAVVTITDNDDATAKAIVLSPASITVEEENATGTPYAVKLASQPSGAVTVTLSGLSGTDLILSGTTLNADGEHTLSFTDSNWDTAQTVTVKSNHDADPFDDNVYLLHRAMGGGYDSASRTLPVTVTDNDTAAVVLTPDSITVGEGETAGVNYTVKLSHAPTSAVTVTIGGHSGTALSISGTTLNASDELTFTASNWSAAQTVTVKADNDDNAASESLKLTHTPSGGGYSAAADLTVMVTDDDTAAIVLSDSALTLTEGDDTGVSYTVNLATQPSETVTVTIGGHAGTDLSISGTTLSNTNMLTFTASNWDTAQTVTVKAGEDANADDESETLTHTASGGDYANITRDLPATVTDDAPDTVTVSFGAASYTVAESDDSDTPDATENTVEVTVTLDADPERTVVIPIEVANQGGTTTADYSGVPQSVTFDSGDTSKTFTFTAAHDTVDDDGESVLLSFGATLPDGVSAGTPAMSAVTITDDDDPQVTVSFGSAAYTVAESDDSDTPDATENTVEVTLTLSADPERTVVIPIEATDQGATSDDYSVPPSVTFNATETSKSFTFMATEDSINDDGESVLLAFGALPGGVSAGTPNQATVSITDDDVPSVTVSFGSDAYTVAEGGTQQVTVTLSADPEHTVVIPIEAANEGGATTADYSGVPENVTFDSGDTSKSFTLTAAHDTVDDDGESVLLRFGAMLPDGVSAGTPATSTVTITDDDVPSVTVSFGSDAYTVAEGGTQQVTLTLSADPERTVVIPIEAANQGGATTADYSGVPQNVTFDSGDTSKSFTFTAEADAIDDDGESVLLSFGATLPDGVSAGTPTTSAVTITDDDVPSVTVSFGSDAYTVAEGGTQQVTVTLSADPEHTVVIPIEAANQGGASGSDYSGVPQSVTFDSGDTSKTFTFTAAHDTVDDDGESVLLSFGATLPDGVSAGTPATSAVSITDDDVPSVTVSFGAASYTVAEGSSRTVTVTLDADSERTVVIPIEAANQGGATTTDYSGVPQNVTFDSGDTSKSFTFMATEDSINDDGESVLLAFGALPGGVSAGTPNQATVSITDDDVPSVTVSFGSDAYTVAEGGTQQVTVTLSADPEHTVVIPIEAANEGGATTADYSGVPENVTFDSGTPPSPSPSPPPTTPSTTTARACCWPSGPLPGWRERRDTSHEHRHHHRRRRPSGDGELRERRLHRGRERRLGHP